MAEEEKKKWWRKQPSWWTAVGVETQRDKDAAAVRAAKLDWWTSSSYKGTDFQKSLKTETKTPVTSTPVTSSVAWPASVSQTRGSYGGYGSSNSSSYGSSHAPANAFEKKLMASSLDDPYGFLKK
jgi:hypothetical protein